jgi:hypothetical protein
MRGIFFDYLNTDMHVTRGAFLLMIGLFSALWLIRK